VDSENLQKEIDDFLISFKELIQIDFYFASTRMKNIRTIAKLNYNKSDVKRELLNLKQKNYSKGPSEDHDKTKPGLIWIFGKTIKEIEIYIKIKVSQKYKQSICISFHEAERPLDYPLKKSNNI
jgi:hypothetical protein